jgi:hypothetical protein
MKMANAINGKTGRVLIKLNIAEVHHCGWPEKRYVRITCSKKIESVAIERHPIPMGRVDVPQYRRFQRTTQDE